ncbi:virulence factor TspB C-terminal domain-related protein [Neisseria iguanae]|uniref:virulence factor TspB C-terminal domain-related protein n=1 Tax=Neisseria iguanae TaxID=90242 RepID=UPI001B80C2BB|nr:virulence factor TspB C-terminal domain-related protein [Neisseria iguanae]
MLKKIIWAAVAALFFNGAYANDVNNVKLGEVLVTPCSGQPDGTVLKIGGKTYKCGGGKLIRNEPSTAIDNSRDFGSGNGANMGSGNGGAGGGSGSGSKSGSGSGSGGSGSGGSGGMSSGGTGGKSVSGGSSGGGSSGGGSGGSSGSSSGGSGSSGSSGGMSQIGGGGGSGSGGSGGGSAAAGGSSSGGGSSGNGSSASGGGSSGGSGSGGLPNTDDKELKSLYESWRNKWVGIFKWYEEEPKKMHKKLLSNISSCKNYNSVLSRAYKACVDREVESYEKELEGLRKNLNESKQRMAKELAIINKSAGESAGDTSVNVGGVGAAGSSASNSSSTSADNSGPKVFETGTGENKDNGNSNSNSSKDGNNSNNDVSRSIEKMTDAIDKMRGAANANAASTAENGKKQDETNSLLGQIGKSIKDGFAALLAAVNGDGAKNGGQQGGGNGQSGDGGSDKGDGDGKGENDKKDGEGADYDVAEPDWGTLEKGDGSGSGGGFKKAGAFSEGGHCPADIPIDLGQFGTVSFQMRFLCDAASRLRPVIVMFAWLMASMMVYRTLNSVTS